MDNFYSGMLDGVKGPVGWLYFGRIYLAKRLTGLLASLRCTHIYLEFTLSLFDIS